MNGLAITPTVAHLINVATHAPGIVYATWYGRWGEFNLPLFALTASIVASCAMHLSETKHGLTGLLGLGRVSHHLLNIDRLFAVILALVVASHAQTWQSPFYIVLFVLATVATIIGEVTSNLSLYLAMHSFWHLSVFYMAGHIVTSAQGGYPDAWMWSHPALVRRVIFTIGVLVGVSIGLILVVIFHPPQITPALETFIPGIVCRVPYNESEARKILRLTIDDGPSVHSHKILDVIEQFNVKASYFTPGENLRNVSLGNVRHRFASLGTVENHMFVQEAPAIKMDVQEFADSIRMSQEVIDALHNESGRRPKQQGLSWLRAASGRVSEAQLAHANASGYRVVLGSVHPFDAKPYWFWRLAWRLAVVHLKIWFTLVDQLMPEYGQPIVILHDREWTVDVLEAMIPWWKARGWTVQALPPCQ
jgi:peptidoglycan/xylan/chitin deacetylase (PgdA/CDA1 family)